MNAPTAFPDQKPVPPYKHTPLFPLGTDTAPYKKITAEGVRVERVLGKDMLVVSRDALRALSEAAFGDINHYLRPGHLKQLRSILDDKEASDNDKFVAFDFLKNANIAAGGVLPMCQDTGTAIIMGKKGCNVITDGDDEAALSEGARDAYLRRNLRYSQVAPLTMYEEKNTANNMPAQCEIYAEGGSSEIDSAYKFMFMAKGGGSANKSFLFQATPSVLTKDRLLAFLKEKVLTLGTAACPPYHLAIVIGGTSAELCMKTVKLASARYLDALPTQGSADGNAFRDLEMEQEILKMTQSLGVGAQFGGKYFCHDVRVIRMPRHGASLPIGLGVSCSADRQVLGKITKDGVYLEELEHNPAQYLPEVEQALGGEVVKIDLDKPMKEILATLSQYPIKTRVSMTGTMIVARDSAHAKLRERLEKGEPLPDYFKNHPVYYAGPAKTPDGYASGAFGPTTAGRMDSFVDQFQAAGGSMVMVAKGNRAVAVREACKKYGGFYLGSIGGAAANLAEHCIKKVEVVEYPELGMEAIWRIEVVDFPAFIIVDDKGNDFFKELNLG
jgi:fumarate hydratase, class I